MRGQGKGADEISLITVRSSFCTGDAGCFRAVIFDRIFATPRGRGQCRRRAVGAVCGDREKPVRRACRRQGSTQGQDRDRARRRRAEVTSPCLTWPRSRRGRP
ncbi:hypothetical protein RHECNPAF_1260025 [Rhizobium etli CNPAF512]|nr:hypothetical protein RHECNPAF_1260025 [Rhizobium etli CNPAF512]